MGSVGGFDDWMTLQSPHVKQDDYAMGMGAGIGGMYGWQNPWSSQSQMMSRVREEKFDGPSNSGSYIGDSMRSSAMFGGQEVLRRGYLGAC